MACVVALYIAVFKNITPMLTKDSVLHVPGNVNAWEPYLKTV